MKLLGSWWVVKRPVSSFYLNTCSIFFPNKTSTLLVWFGLRCPCTIPVCPEPPLLSSQNLQVSISSYAPRVWTYLTHQEHTQMWEKASNKASLMKKILWNWFLQYNWSVCNDSVLTITDINNWAGCHVNIFYLIEQNENLSRTCGWNLEDFVLKKNNIFFLVFIQTLLF